VAAGSVDLKENVQTHDVEQIIWHEEYDMMTVENDIGLVKV
jgi:hypothetical protein